MHRLSLILIFLMLSAGFVLPVAADDAPVKPLRVYTCQRLSSYPPFYAWLRNARGPIGQEPDIARAIGREIGRPILFVQLPTDVDLKQPRIDVLLRDRADAVISCFTITPARAEQVAFSRPYYADGLGAVVRADSPIQTVDQLADRTVIAWRHTTAYTWVRKHLPNATIIDAFPPGFIGEPQDLIVQRRADAYIIDRSHLTGMADADDQLRLLPQRLTTEHWGIAARKGDAALLKSINDALVKLEENGTMDELRSRP